MKRYTFPVVYLIAILSQMMLLFGIIGCQAERYPPLRLATQIARETQKISATATAVARFATVAEMSPVHTDPEARMATQVAIEDLAQRLGVLPSAIHVLKVAAVEWSDTSLGCPKEGMMYAQVITPGFLILLQAQGRLYEYHTDRGNYAVLCLPPEE